MLPASSETFASATSATLIAPTPSVTTFQTMSTVRSARVCRTTRKPSPMSRPVTAALDMAHLESRRRDSREQEGGDDECDRVHPVGEIRPPRGEDHAADDRPDHPGQVLDRLQQRGGGGELLVVDEVRHPGVDRRPEEAGRDALDRREDDDHRRAARERERAEDRGAHEVGDDQEAAPREPVDQRPGQDPDQDDRQELDQQQRADPLARPGPVEDVDRERDGGEIRPGSGAERGEEEAPEVGREAEDSEAEDARDANSRASEARDLHSLREELRRTRAARRRRCPATARR